jgi:hypothetical protein
VFARTSLVEMYTLLQFVMPSVFSGDADSFIKMFDKPFDGAEGEDSATLNEEERLLLTTRLHEARSHLLAHGLCLLRVARICCSLCVMSPLRCAGAAAVHAAPREGEGCC